MTNRQKYRILEIIPGSLVWITFILSIVLSFIAPLPVIYFIILFDFYWLIRVTYFVFYLFVSWKKYKENQKIDWFAKVKEIKNWERIYHIIFFPVYKENIQVMRTTFNCLINSSFPTDKIIIVLSGEERNNNKDEFLKNAEIIKNEFGDNFFRLLITTHPDDLPNEIKAKGANANWAGHRAKEMIDELGIPYDDIIVSYFDIDTCPDPEYFSYLTYKYLTHPKPTRTSFQPVALYNNNIWEANAVTRVAAFGTTFWLMTELARPERLFTFSSHSMSWRALVDVGFWQKDIVTDDSRIFLQCFIHYNGDYTVTPMYIPVSMDATSGSNFWESIVNLYKQQRRWAWGIEHFPYMAWNFSNNKLIPFRKKIKYFWNLGEGMYSWATAPILIFILGRLPLIVAPQKVKSMAIFQNTPHILQWLMTLAMIGIFVSAIINLFLLPPIPKGKRKFTILIMSLQWILLPVTLILFGSIPATDAQTRMMLGKYLGFFNTPKVRAEAKGGSAEAKA
jgi:hypothetical protein